MIAVIVGLFCLVAVVALIRESKIDNVPKWYAPACWGVGLGYVVFGVWTVMQL